jgi:hypothetical protein
MRGSERGERGGGERERERYLLILRHVHDLPHVLHRVLTPFDVGVDLGGIVFTAAIVAYDEYIKMVSCNISMFLSV